MLLAKAPIKFPQKTNDSKELWKVLFWAKMRAFGDKTEGYFNDADYPHSTYFEL